MNVVAGVFFVTCIDFFGMVNGDSIFIQILECCSLKLSKFIQSAIISFY
jgi:hypothetical protein